MKSAGKFLSILLSLFMAIMALGFWAISGAIWAVILFISFRLVAYTIHVFSGTRWMDAHYLLDISISVLASGAAILTLALVGWVLFSVGNAFAERLIDKWG